MVYKLELTTIEESKNLHEFLDLISEETNFVSFDKSECPSEEECRSLLKSTQEKPNYAYCIKNDEKIIASLTGITRGGRSRERHKSDIGLAVAKSHWGKGIGSLLMEKVIEESKKNSISKVTLTVNEENTRAIKLYKKYGFEIEGRYKEDMLINGVMVTGVSMALFL